MGQRTRIDPERVRELAAKGMSDGEIGEVMGTAHFNIAGCRRRNGIPAAFRRGQRPESAKRRQAASLSRTRRAKWPHLAAQIEPLAASGMFDTEIGGRLGVTRDTVRHIRETFGIQPGRRQAAWDRFIAGVHAVKSAATAEAFGLPGWLTRTQVKLVVALTGGHLTRRQLCVAIGVGSGALGYGKRHGQRVNQLQELIEAGLVATAQHPGRWQGRLYMLTLKAMNLLAADPKEPAHG